ncbi:hypothetical protein NEIPOLOT_00877 [Neisseria polysaccharea ATCC 43768]|nr:hypothetical protein NEIPOLOT_00877 [Neisseria polysaccharea ATCC 43768]
MNLVKLPVNNLQAIAIIALVGTLLAVSHHQGYKSAFAKQQAVIDKMEKDKAQALLLSAQNYALELELARAEAKKYEVKAHAVGMALAKKQAEVSRLKTENKRKLKMSLLKTVKMQAAVVLTALAITACSSTSAPSATEIKVVEKAVMPTPPAALMVAPVRPNPPKDGKTATLLEHAAEFGGYVSELENQNQAWRDWVNSQAAVDGSEGTR